MVALRLSSTGSGSYCPEPEAVIVFGLLDDPGRPCCYVGFGNVVVRNCSSFRWCGQTQQGGRGRTVWMLPDVSRAQAIEDPVMAQQPSDATVGRLLFVRALIHEPEAQLGGTRHIERQVSKGLIRTGRVRTRLGLGRDAMVVFGSVGGSRGSCSGGAREVGCTLEGLTVWLRHHLSTRPANSLRRGAISKTACRGPACPLSKGPYLGWPGLALPDHDFLLDYFVISRPD